MINGEYWSRDFPGLTEEQADQIMGLAVPIVDLGAIVLDPRTSMVRGYDRGSVGILIKCLEVGIASDTLNYVDQAGAESMLEDCRDWLEQADDDGR